MPDGSINPWVIAVTVTLATFMEVLDTSIANVALPHISGSLSAGADEWAVAGRMDYGQFFVEMDFLHQHPGGNNFAALDVCTGKRSTVHEKGESERRIPRGLHRNRIDQPGARQHADYFGQGTARGLAGERIHPDFRGADAGGIDCGDFLGVAAGPSGGGFADVEEPEFCDRDDGDVFSGFRAVFEHGADSADAPAIAGVYGGDGRAGAVAGRRGDHVDDAGGGIPGVKSGHEIFDFVRMHRVLDFAVRDGGVEFATGLPARGLWTNAAELRAGVSVHPD